MLQNIKRCPSCILIDTEFLINKINEVYNFYRRKYPNRELLKFDILDFIDILTSTARINVSGDEINVVFFYRLDNSKIPHSTRITDVFGQLNDLTPMTFEYIKDTRWNLYSFYADPEGNEVDYDEEYSDLMIEIVNKEDVFTIVLCKDGWRQNYWLESFNENIDKSFYIFRSFVPEIGIRNNIGKFMYVTVEYAIAMCFGIERMGL